MDREPVLLVAWRLNRWVPLVIGALLLLNVVIYLLMSHMVAPSLNQLERELIERQAAARLTRQAATEAKSPVEIFRRGKEDLERFREAIPPRNEFTGLIGEIFSLAGHAGLTIDRIGYEPKEVKGQNLLRYGLAFSVRGEYGEIKRFIYSLEQSPRLIVIEDLSLSGEGKAGKDQVELRLRLETFFRTEEP